MKAKRREKILLLAFLAAITLWQGLPWAEAIFFTPLDDRLARIRQLEDAVAKKKIKQRELQQAAVKLKSWGERSLPPDPVTAATLYQNWLIELGIQSQFKSVVVTSRATDNRPRGNTYYAITSRISAQGTLKSLCQFLYDFEKAGLLQRIGSLSCSTQKHDGDPLLEMTIVVDALALTNSPKRSTLRALPTLEPGRPLPPRESFDGIAAKNIFVRGYNGPPAPQVEPRPRVEGAPPRRETPAEPPFDAAEFTYLSAFFSNGQQAEIWLFDRSSNRPLILAEGDEFEIGNIKGRVMYIEDEFADMLVEGVLWRLELGRNLRQMEKVKPPAQRPS